MAESEGGLHSVCFGAVSAGVCRLETLIPVSGLGHVGLAADGEGVGPLDCPSPRCSNNKPCAEEPPNQAQRNPKRETNGTNRKRK